MYLCDIVFKLLEITVLLTVASCHSIDYIAEDSEVRGEIKDESEKYTQYLIRDSNPEGYICLTDQCLRKCCPIGQGIQNANCVSLSSSRNASFNAYALKYNISSFHVISNGFTCNESVHIVQNPQLNVSAVPYMIELRDDDIFIQEYCVDYFQNIEEIGAFFDPRQSWFVIRVVLSSPEWDVDAPAADRLLGGSSRFQSNPFPLPSSSFPRPNGSPLGSGKKQRVSCALDQRTRCDVRFLSHRPDSTAEPSALSRSFCVLPVIISTEFLCENSNVSYDNVDVFNKNVLSISESEDELQKCLCNPERCVYKCCPIGEEIANLTCQSSAIPRITGLKGYVGSHLILNGFSIIHQNIDCFDAGMTRFIIDPRSSYPMPERFIITEDISKLESELQRFCVDFFNELNVYAGLICVESNSDVVESSTVGKISAHFSELQ
ncbi:hypothetical protein Trydic_g8847 [Trypoxylus dichotomus]